MRIFLLITLLCLTTGAFPQVLSNLRSVAYSTLSDTVRLDTLSIVPGSLIVTGDFGKLPADSLFEIDYPKSLLVLKDKSVRGPVAIQYRVMPYNLAREHFHKSISDIRINPEGVRKPFTYNFNESAEEDFFGRDQLEKRGSISRGISFGNNQDVIVNSSLNLQLSGKISDNLNVMAAISDNNIPIQPDGNTQQIQEFDKVYIQLYNEKIKLIMGDFQLGKPAGHFMNLNKKAQGGLFTVKAGINKEKRSEVVNTVSGAMAKGKYCRQSLQGQECNQGPYRIRGCNNETYIIILAGSERVYIDGKMLTRGQENDYVIDYNTAELTFTPAQPITKDRRIIIEFEYSDRNYARFMVFNSTEFRTEKAKYWLNVYSEHDSKNQPINMQLTDEQKQKLFDVGDSLQLAVVPNITDTLFSNDLILYALKDTILDDGTYIDSIFVYSTDPDSARYKLGFSYTGENNGNYVQAMTSANGRVYKWVAPVNGTMQGRYEPVVLLITPKKKQMVTAGGTMKLTRTTTAGFEAGLTNNDINTFSPYNNNDDIGYAVKLLLTQEIIMKDTANSRFFTTAAYQLVDRYFDPLERFRSAEFERDWNLASGNDKSTEHLLHLDLDYINKKIGKALYESDYMHRETGFAAFKNGITSSLRYKGFRLDFSGSFLTSEDTVNTTRFLRHKAMLAKDIRFLTVGIREEQEDNRWQFLSTDSLLANSYSYDQWEVFINNADTASRKVFAKYVRRRDRLPFENSLKYSTLGEDVNAGIHFTKNPLSIIRVSGNYRRLTIIDTLVTSANEENTITGRAEYNLKLFRGALASSTFYEIGSGLEMKKEFSYIRVAAGQGIYKWVDYNGNGVKELDEFEVANFQDEAEYIRIFTPTTDYIKTYSNQFNQLISFNPVRVWRNKTGMLHFLSRFSNQFAFRVNRKNISEDLLLSANPFYRFPGDSLLVSSGTSVRNTFSFNKSGAKAGADYLYQGNSNRILLVNGIDTRNHVLHGLRIRWNISKQITMLNNFTNGIKTFESEFFSTKNYEIPYYSDETTLSLQPGLSYRISLTYKYSDKKNRLGTEVSTGHTVGAELRYNAISKGSVSVKADYIILTFNEDRNTPVAYEMLEGLQPGNNGVWTVMINRDISTGLQMCLTYTGRVSEGAPAVHNGGIQLRASF
ncbi:MAG: hypothetical protein KJ607_03485 [Bacteroidetes bacterium]|nr:hypothetical protein [Bacteroidota bacterium]